MSLTNHVIRGQWRLLEKIGAGAFGEIYLAKTIPAGAADGDVENCEKYVAVKVEHVSQHPSRVSNGEKFPPPVREQPDKGGEVNTKDRGPGPRRRGSQDVSGSGRPEAGGAADEGGGIAGVGNTPTREKDADREAEQQPRLVPAELPAQRPAPPNPKFVLKLEVAVIRRLQGCSHVARFHSCGRFANPEEGQRPLPASPYNEPELPPGFRFNYLVMELLGRNLADVRRDAPEQRFSVTTAALLGHHMLRGIEEMHRCGYIHRDVKPSNFALPRDTAASRKVYVIDFGLARRYVQDARTNPFSESGSSVLVPDAKIPSGLPPGTRIRPPRAQVGFRGTARYASVHSHAGEDLGRRDDLWSLLYSLVEMVVGMLPWRRLRDKDEVGKAKLDVHSPELLCAGTPAVPLPPEFGRFMEHLLSLQFDDCPNYKLLDGLLLRCARREQSSLASVGSPLGSGPKLSLRNLKFDWELPVKAEPTVSETSDVDPGPSSTLMSRDDDDDDGGGDSGTETRSASTSDNSDSEKTSSSEMSSSSSGLEDVEGPTSLLLSHASQMSRTSRGSRMSSLASRSSRATPGPLLSLIRPTPPARARRKRPRKRQSTKRRRKKDAVPADASDKGSIFSRLSLRRSKKSDSPKVDSSKQASKGGKKQQPKPHDSPLKIRSSSDKRGSKGPPRKRSARQNPNPNPKAVPKNRPKPKRRQSSRPNSSRNNSSRNNSSRNNSTRPARQRRKPRTPAEKAEVSDKHASITRTKSSRSESRNASTSEDDENVVESGILDEFDDLRSHRRALSSYESVYVSASMDTLHNNIMKPKRVGWNNADEPLAGDRHSRSASLPANEPPGALTLGESVSDGTIPPPDAGVKDEFKMDSALEKPVEPVPRRGRPGAGAGDSDKAILADLERKKRRRRHKATKEEDADLQTASPKGSASLPFDEDTSTPVNTLTQTDGEDDLELTLEPPKPRSRRSNRYPKERNRALGKKIDERACCTLQ
jgi:serine/threonine protein kinase